jgi:uncharacterized protein involved in exopolysaccharide biosynthesis
MSDLSPREVLERYLDLWWILAACMILGGIAGWGFSHFRPPIYEATAAYEVSLDQQQIANRLFTPLSHEPLDTTTQNTYLSPVENTFVDIDVRNRLVADATAQGIRLKFSDINMMNFTIDRRSVRWLLTVRNTDPVVAAHLANLWITTADQALRDAQAHSTRAQTLQTQRDAVLKCFSELDFARANQCAGTSFSAPAELDGYLNQLSQQINSEVQAGQNIDPALIFVFAQQAEPPSTPVLYVTSSIILAGSLLGLLIGILVVQAVPAARSQEQ